MLFDHKEAMERINRIYRELGVPPDDEDALTRWERDESSRARRR